jgi:hypothetical protein
VPPSATYAERLRAREATLSRLDQLHARVGNTRLVIAAVALAAAWGCFDAHAFSVVWLAIPLAGFAGLVLYHQRIERRRSLARRAAAYYRTGLDRIEDRWAGSGSTGEELFADGHLYARDLDVFGRGSLFELLCTARTPGGQRTLARWLSAPSSLPAIRERHAAITDLRGRVDLRERLAIVADQPRITRAPEALSAWAEAPNGLDRPWIPWAAGALTVAALAGAVVWALWGLAFPFIAILAVELAAAYLLRAEITAVFAGIESAFEDLNVLAGQLQTIEVEPFATAPLRELVRGLSSHALSASAALSRLATIVNLIDSRQNPFLRPLLPPLMYSVHVALAGERWRSRHGRVVSSWLAAIGEIEALNSIAGYSFERPGDPFPEFIEGDAAFHATGLGHPLLPAGSRVRNDVAIGGAPRVLLVSGSNMSGKSTLLRTVGINTVLAMAGAPVCAARLRLVALQVGASIQAGDSLQTGTSRFYAEIGRLRALLDCACRSPPLLFLLDELLQGTNSRDRRIGAEGLLRALLARGAIGLVSTHDLALADMPGLESGALKNVHFRDVFASGGLVFDFKLRDGVVTTSNGIELMRAIGLEV